MHPSVYAADPASKSRRTPRKRERRASCTATMQTPSDEFPSKPASLTRIGKTSSPTSTPPKPESFSKRGMSHSLRGRRTSCTATMQTPLDEFPSKPASLTRIGKASSPTLTPPKPESFSKRGSSHSLRGRRTSYTASMQTPLDEVPSKPASLTRIGEKNHSPPTTPSRPASLSNLGSTHSKTQRRSSLSAIPSQKMVVSQERRTSLNSSPSYPFGKPRSKVEKKLERSYSFSSNPTLPFGSGSSHAKVERRLSHSKMERRPSHSRIGRTIMIERRNSMERRNSTERRNSMERRFSIERRGSTSSTASLSDSYSTMGSVCSEKSCTFRDEPEIIEIQSAKSLTNNPNEIWYVKEDFDSFREKTRRIVSNVDENGRGKNGKKYCTRGLERYMGPKDEARRDIRKNILKALDEDDSISLGSLSRASVIEALERAELDAKEAGAMQKRYMRRASDLVRADVNISQAATLQKRYMRRASVQ